MRNRVIYARKSRKRPCEHTRHYNSGKSTQVNRGIAKRTTKKRNLLSKAAYSLVWGIAKGYISSELSNNRFNLQDSISRNALRQAAIAAVVSQTGFPSHLVAPVVDKVLFQT